MQKNLVKLSYLAQKMLQRGQVPALLLVDLPRIPTQNNGQKMPIFVTPYILPSHTGFKNIFTHSRSHQSFHVSKKRKYGICNQIRRVFFVLYSTPTELLAQLLRISSVCHILMIEDTQIDQQRSYLIYSHIGKDKSKQNLPNFSKQKKNSLKKVNL